MKFSSVIFYECYTMRKVEHRSSWLTAVKSKVPEERKALKGMKTPGQRTRDLKNKCYLTICLACTPLPVTTAFPHPHTHTHHNPTKECLGTAFWQWLKWDPKTLWPHTCFHFQASYFTLVLVLLSSVRKSGPRPRSTWKRSGWEAVPATSLLGFESWPIAYSTCGQGSLYNLPSLPLCARWVF